MMDNITFGGTQVPHWLLTLILKYPYQWHYIVGTYYNNIELNICVTEKRLFIDVIYSEYCSNF